MTPEERAMLTELADKIAKTPTPAHDPEADEFIRTHIGNRPDALYILTQTTLIQNLAIQHAQQEIQELKQRLAQPVAAQPASSFLGAGVTPGGSRPAPIPGSSTWSSPAPVAPPMPPPTAQNAPPAAERPSFLRSAAQTAAGVAAGAFAFEGIRALFGGGGFGGWGGPHLGGIGGGSFLGGAPGGETIVNNYYDDARDASDRSERNDRRSEDSSSNDTAASASSDDADTTNEDTASDSDDTSSDGDTYADDGGYDDGGGSGGDDFV